MTQSPPRGTRDLPGPPPRHEAVRGPRPTGRAKPRVRRRPQPIPVEQRNIAIVCQAAPAALLAWSPGELLSLVIALALYLVYRTRGAFARQHLAASLNLEGTLAILLLLSMALPGTLIGLVLFPVVVVATCLQHVLAALAASREQLYRPRFVFRFVS